MCFSASRYSGTGKAIWSPSSGTWSTTCWRPSCCCVYVPTSTFTASGRSGCGSGSEEQDQPGNTWPCQDQKVSQWNAPSWKPSDQIPGKLDGCSGTRTRCRCCCCCSPGLDEASHWRRGTAHLERKSERKKKKKKRHTTEGLFTRMQQFTASAVIGISRHQANV